MTILVISAVFAAMGDEGRALLAYDRSDILAGQWWRLVSGHIVHLGWPHFLMNGVGLLLVWLLVGQCYSERTWVAIFLAIVAGIDVGFWFLNPSLESYVGLSGVLHGLLVAGLVGELGDARWDTWLLLIGVAIKLGFEQVAGPIPGSESTAGGTVIVDAHLYGAVCGALIGAGCLIRVRRTPAI